ncbi:hypothetical protein SAMN05216410_3222 [Sanguibacter gelidistatuariae]|uniref:Uncharacterized protein n=1 Tax=Sanguibacter gelidistatuariae TaxID=1814289 RepID=A0A1G6UB57_9MICO|nr:hypothetical protein [Sanguibacter gelidistatuariae]SDD38632.1 hypothetical protein SAMN05216410_3222 [Sanguibacter gelidistatuariae]
MNLSTRAVASACAAAAIAGGAYLGAVPLLVVLGALVVLFAAGWAPLLGLPVPGGTFFVVVLPGLGALAAAQVTQSEPWLANLPLVVAMGVLLAFINELLRGDGRERLVESLVGGVSGMVVAVSAAGWISAYKTDDGMSLVVLSAVSLAAASAASAARLHGWLTLVATIVGSVVVAIAVALVMPDLAWLDGLWTGLVAGALIGSLQLLFDKLPELRRPRAALAAIVLPVAVGGILVYVVGRILVG